MRKLKYGISLLLSAGMLLAANPFTGKWKMNHQKSSQTKADTPKDENDTPKDENRVISDQGNQLVVVITGTDADGTPIAIHYIVPAGGGAGQMQQSSSYNGVSTKRVNDNTTDTMYTKDGKELAAEHMVVSSDGQTMTVTVKGVDSDGKPVEHVLVFDKE